LLTQQILNARQLLGWSIFIKSKDDRYGKGYRISPSFSGEKDKDKIVYDSTVLPEIYKLLSSAPTTVADNNKALFDAGHLSLLRNHPAGLYFKAGKRAQISAAYYSIWPGHFLLLVPGIHQTGTSPK
jgi:hypothetical protein